MTQPRRVLVLGGIRSGKSGFAEELLATAPAVRYLATAREDPADPEWQGRIAAHRDRRPDSWQTVECGPDPHRLARELAEAPPDAAVLVDDLGTWLAALDGTDAPTAALADAVRTSPAARIVLVSPEVGLSVVPAEPVARAFTDTLGELNRAVADACDAIALVVAGRPLWLTATPAPAEPTPPAAVAPVVAPVVAPEPPAEPAPEVPAPDTSAADSEFAGIRPPDRIAINQVRDRLNGLAVAGTGLGALADPVAWALGSTGSTTGWDSVRVVLVGADHAGGAAAGAAPGSAYAATVAEGTAPLARLAGRAGVPVQIVDAGLTDTVPGVTDTDRIAPAAPIETTDALTLDQVDQAIELGRRIADAAADEGVQALVPAACGAGTEPAAVALLAASSGAEAATLLGRVVHPDGRVDDEAWMARCVAARDALHRIRERPRDTRALLAMLGGADLAVLTGLLLGAALRRTPVLVDNPATAAAMVLARDLAPGAPWWCLVPDAGRHPAVTQACDTLGLDRFLDLGLGLGDGAAALTALGVLRPALDLAVTLPDLPVGANA